MISMALALSSEQLAALHQSADGVPPRWRQRYFAAVVRSSKAINTESTRSSETPGE
jgi:hypothetical protein